MNRQPDYRRRRIVVAAMALGLLALMPIVWKRIRARRERDMS